MTTFHAWKDAPFTDRLSVYDNYIYIICKRGDNTALDFEEFNQLYRYHSFYSVANMFGVAE